MLLLCVLTISGLGACTSLTDMKSDLSERMFGRQVTDPPAELNEIKATITPKVVWKAQLGKAEQFDFLPATADGAVYAASAEGDVFKFDAATGKQAWKVNAGEKLSGGVGLGGKLVLVGSSSGYVIAHDLSGKLLWKSKVSS
ncbi:MAG TPA: PQQ-binding-like beta-propeller repeat protein, partial [Methyloradius sp.]